MDATHSVSPSFLRLKHIIGDQKARPPNPAHYSGIKNNLVEWCPSRPIPSTNKIER